MDYDAIIIGATAEGVSAALTGSSIGMNVALVDVDGFIASRASPPGPFVLSLLHDALMEIRAAHRVLGKERSTSELRAIFSRALVGRRRQVVATYHAELRYELAARGAHVLRGPARFRSPNEIEVAGREVHRASVIVIACGSRPRRPDRFPFDGRTVCDPDSLLDPDGVPRNLVVVGADLIGCEFSCMFAQLGSNVTLIDRRNRLLRFVDADLREVLHAWMQRSGVTVVLGEGVEEIEVLGSESSPHASVRLASGRVEIGERVLVAAGSTPNTDGLDLARPGIATDPRGFVTTDDRFETCVKGVYALGGAVDGLASTTMRIHQGRVAMFCAAGVQEDGENPTPMVIYTVPEIAMVGLSEEACGLLDIPHVVGRTGLSRSLRSRVRGEDAGLMKLVISNDTRRLLGVHLIGTAAAEVVGLGSALVRSEKTVEEIASIGVSPQSLSEAYQRAALDALAKLGRPAPAPTEARESLTRAF
ncbi:MAG: dihydrolipoyl dehydrogenase family protein [Myxococcota bacterium]